MGAVEADSPGLFRNANLYIGEIENRYLIGETRRKVIYHLYKLPQVTIYNEKQLLHDGEVFDIDGVRIDTAHRHPMMPTTNRTTPKKMQRAVF